MPEATSENPPADNPPVNPPVNDPPKSPAIVKRTQLKPPKQAVETEKQIKALQEGQSKIEDRIDGIDGALADLNGWLEKTFSGSRSNAKGPSVLEDLDNDIFGKS